MAIHTIVKGLAVITSPLKLNSKTRVKSRALIVTGVRTPKNFSLNQISPLVLIIHFLEKYPATRGRAT